MPGAWRGGRVVQLFKLQRFDEFVAFNPMEWSFFVPCLKAEWCYTEGLLLVTAEGNASGVQRLLSMVAFIAGFDLDRSDLLYLPNETAPCTASEYLHFQRSTLGPDVVKSMDDRWAREEDERAKKRQRGITQSINR